MASYRGAPFEAGIGPTDDDIVLFAACPPPEDLGFEPATGHWRRQLRITDVQAVWESRPVGTFRGERCMVLDDLGDRLHIGYLGHDGYQAEQLGYWQVDRGVFELVAPRTDVSEILEERTEYPRGTATGGLANGKLAPEPGYPHSGAHSILPGPQTGLSGQTTLSGQQTTSEHAMAERTLADEMLSGQPAASSDYLDSWADAPRRPLENLTQDPALPASYLPPADLELYPGQPAPPSRGYPAIPSYPAEIPVSTGSLDPLAYRHVVDDTTGVALPVTAEAPLPVEAEAMRAASASRRPLQPTGHGRNGLAPADRSAAAPAEPARPLYVVPNPVSGPAQSEPTQSEPTQPEPAPLGLARLGHPRPELGQPGPAHSAAPSRQRRAARRRMATERLFADLASQAGIPADSYAVGEEVEGAMCLIQTDSGFEVFHSADGARHELQAFTTEESACFYLFGVLAAEAVQTGSLGRLPVVRS